VSFNSSPHDWSDGFRLVRKQKYENTDQLVGRYGQVVEIFLFCCKAHSKKKIAEVKKGRFYLRFLQDIK